MKKLLVITLILSILFAPLSVLAAPQMDSDPSSLAIMLVNPDSGTVVFQKNADEKMNPASTAMLMTYILASESISNPDVTKISARKEVLDSLGSVDPNNKMGLVEGEETTVQTLIGAMMVGNAVDAAYTLADYIGKGNIQNFVDTMNQKASDLGCKNTNFTNPAGLYDAKSCTTASDLYLITKYASALPKFSEWVALTAYTIPPTNKSTEERTLTNPNALINPESEYYYEYAKGIISGSTAEQGYNVISSAVKDNSRYICVALGSPSGGTNGAYTDTINLFEWAFKNFKIKSIVISGQVLSEVTIKKASKLKTLPLAAENTFSASLPNDVDPSAVTITPHIPEEVTAPITKGQVIGTATLSYDGQDLTQINLIAAQEATVSAFVKFLQVAKITGIIILVLLVIVFTYVQVHNYNVRKRKRLRKERLRKEKIRRQRMNRK